MTGFGGAVGLAPRAQEAMLVVSVLLLVVGGAADMASAAFRTSMLQSAASDAVRGRLQGVFVVVVAGGPRVADVLHGAAASVIGTALTVALGGVLVLVGLAVSVALVPSFYRYRVADQSPSRCPDRHPRCDGRVGCTEYSSGCCSTRVRRSPAGPGGRHEDGPDPI